MVRFVAAVAALPFMLAGGAFAHDHWINHGNYVSPVDGVHCCGDNDCFQIANDDVKVTAGGYLVVSLNEVVPFKEAQKSEDGHFWRCKRPDGKRRCFFAPPPNV
jgi:hypothetical protein